MDTSQWPQEIVGKPVDEIVTKPSVSILERKIRPQKEHVVSCPRCNSSNTKFCYYNNYSLTQPRYFCKTCRRYWTEGGSLRNIPVGGGSRKNKRSSCSSIISNTSPTCSTPLAKKVLDLPQNPNPTPTPTPTHSQDLNLSFPSSHHHFMTSNNNLSAEIVVGGNPIATSASTTTTTTRSSSSHHQLSAMELLTGMAASNSRGMNCFIPMPRIVPDHPGSVYSAGFPDLHDSFKSSLGFSLDGYGGIPTEASNGGGRLMQLPFEDLKQGSNGVEQGKEQGDSTGYWTGMLGGGSW